MDHELSLGGQERWNIENEGFNTQKTGGYQLEHAFKIFAACSDTATYARFQITYKIEDKP